MSAGEAKPDGSRRRARPVAVPEATTIKRSAFIHQDGGVAE